MREKDLVDLTAPEHQALFTLLKKGTASARKVRRAHILLQAAEDTTDDEIADTLRVGVSTVHRTRQGFVEEGLQAALSEQRRGGCSRKLDGKQEAFLVALACSRPPAGRESWTMQVLADRLVELKLVKEVSDGTVRRTLKQTTSSPGNAKSGVSPV